MGFKEWLVPQDRAFFSRLDAMAGHAAEAARLYARLLQEWWARAEHAEAIRAIEHAADEVAHGLFDVLNRTFITPIEREDIARLTHALDDVVDAIHAAALRTVIGRVPKPTPAMTGLAAVVAKQTGLVQQAVAALRKRNALAVALPPLAVEIHRLENEAEALFHDAIASLYDGKDPMAVLRHEPVYELLEAATDRCEDVADVLQDIARTNG